MGPSKRSGRDRSTSFVTTAPVGAWMASDVRSLFLRMVPVFARSGLDEAASMELIGAMLAEFEELRSTMGGRTAFGRRGTGAASAG